MKNTKLVNRLIFILFIFGLTTLVFSFYMYLSFNDHFSPVKLMLSYTLDRPIVYRVFPALVTNAITFLTKLPLSISAILVMYFFLLGFFGVYSLLIKKYLPGSNSYLSLLIASFFLIPFLFQNRYIYDFPILFLFSLAFFLLSKNKYGSYLILFLFASLTKETSLFLIFFYMLRCKKLPKKKYLLILFVQLVIYGITRLTLLIIFHNNPGSIVHYYLVDHINVYLSNPVGSLFLFLCIVGIIIFCFTDKSDNNGLYRDTMVTIGCPLLILYLLFGYPFEIRVFLEVFPIVSLCLTSKLMFLFKHAFGYRKLQNQSF